MSGPRVVRNDWSTLVVPDLGAWTPTLSVSVVIPAFDAARLLPYVLAGLAAQTYPAHLLEVVVADDGPGPPGSLVLPEVRPERTRIVRVEEGWGRANACHTGATAAEGDVVHWLDADMLAEREHVEAQLRWHHASDHVVVLGHKWFVDPAPVLAVAPAQVRDAVAAGTVADFFAGQEHAPHEWVEKAWERTDDLRRAGPTALRTHVGATASVRRELYLDAGGMDTALRLGEDISLGHRLGHAGAVFVPERLARSWHLGASHVMQQRERVNAYNDPYHAEGSPSLRAKRRPGRTYEAPFVEVVLDTAGQPADAVTATVDAVLDSTLHDLRVVLLGPWSTLTEDRRSPLGDPMLDTRLVHAAYRSDPRVVLLEELPDERTAASFRVTLPGADFAPQRPALERLVLHLDHTHDGVRRVRLPDGSDVRVERTAARSRALRVADPGEDVDAVVAQLWGEAVLDAELAGFVPAADARPPAYPSPAGPPVDADEAWERAEKGVRRGRGARRGRPSG